MVWGKKLLQSLSVFAIMLLKRLPDGDGSKMKRRLPGVIWVLDDFSSSAFEAFEVDVLQRGNALRWAQLSAATLCKTLQSWFEELPYHTEMYTGHQGTIQILLKNLVIFYQS